MQQSPVEHAAQATTVQPATREIPHLPNEYVMLGTLLILVTLLPLSIALARRIWRRGGPVNESLPASMQNQLAQMQTAIDSVALEVERIGEGQRFVNSLMRGQPDGARPEALPQIPDAKMRKDPRLATPH